MMVDGQAGEVVPVSTGGPAAASPTGPMPVGVVLDLCDRLLGEIGRRQHRFSWLRPPGGGIEDCLACDAYYPGNRLVVICREDGSEPDGLYAEQVPGNGLRLLVVTPSELGMDRLGASEALTREIGALGPAPERPRGPLVMERPQRLSGAAEGALTRMGASFARAGAPAVAGPRRPEPRSTAVRRASPQRAYDPEREQRFGMLIGVALALVVAAEALILVATVSLGHDHPLLAFGFALDAWARVLGTIAAAREREHGRAWTCMIVGSPAVIGFVLLGPDGTLETEPGPLAGVVAVLATGVVAVALLGALMGI